MTSVVTDTGPLIWLERIGYGKVLHQIYSTIWAPPAVEGELGHHWKLTASVWPTVKTARFKDRKEEARFNRIVRRWMRRHDYTDKADVEVVVLYREFVKADEMLYANQDAEITFGKFGTVRDVYKIYEIAVKNGLWTTADSKKFLETFLKFGYRRDDVEKELDNL